MHKDAITFLQIVRRQRSEVLLHTSTNGLALTSRKIDSLASESLADLIVFSIDGAREDSYRRYRVNGDFNHALANLAALVRACERAGTADRMEIVWQYILFQWNDSDEELTEAKHLAAEIGVPIKWVFTHTEGASLRYTAGSEAAARLYSNEVASRLYGGGDPYNGLTCDMRLKHLWDNEGVASGRYFARLILDRDELRGCCGSRVACRLTVENRSRSEWRNKGERRFRIGMRLRSTTGRVLKELNGLPVPESTVHPGGKGTMLLDFVLPDSLGDYQLFIDVVEEGVCWFSDRSSQPLVCKLKTSNGHRKTWDCHALVELVYRSLFDCFPTPEEVAFHVRQIESGATLESILLSISGAVPSAQTAQFIKRLEQVRSEMIASIDQKMKP